MNGLVNRFVLDEACYSEGTDSPDGLCFRPVFPLSCLWSVPCIRARGSFEVKQVMYNGYYVYEPGGQSRRYPIGLTQPMVGDGMFISDAGLAVCGGPVRGSRGAAC